MNYVGGANRHVLMVAQDALQDIGSSKAACSPHHHWQPRLSADGDISCLR